MGLRDRIDHVARRCSGPSEWRNVGRPQLHCAGNVWSAQAAGQNAGAEVVMGPTTIAFSLDLRPGTAALPGSAHTLPCPWAWTVTQQTAAVIPSALITTARLITGRRMAGTAG